MEFLNGLSDDQTALIGCVGALIVCGTLMSLSYYVGQLFQKTQQSPEPNEPHTLRMPDPLTLQPKKAGPVYSAVRDNPLRRAA